MPRTGRGVPALAALMSRGDLSAAEHRLECRRRILRAEVDDAGRFLLLETVDMYVQLDEAAEAEYERLLAAEVNEEVKIMEMTWSQSLLAEGMEKGRLEGTRAVVLGLLERRFGPLAPSLRGKVERMTSSDELSRLASRLLDAQSVEDLDL